MTSGSLYPVINGSYAETIAPDHLLGMGLEYLVSMTSSSKGEGSFEEFVWVNALNSCHDLEHFYHVTSSSAIVE